MKNCCLGNANDFYVVFNPQKDMIRDAWAKVYQTISEKEDAQPLDQVGDSIKKEASYDFVRSYQLLGRGQK